MNTSAAMMPHVPTVDTSTRVDWAPALLFMIALVQGSSLSISLAARLAPGGSAAAIVTLVWLLAYVLAVAILCLRHGADWVFWLARYRLPLLVLVAGTLASTTWSIDAGLTTERSVHFIGSTLIAIAIGFSLPLSRCLYLATWIFGCLMFVNVVVSLGMPDIGIENYEGQRVWRGVLASKNTLGFWSATAVLLFCTRLMHVNRLHARAALLVLIALALINLVMSSSATSLLAMMVAGMIMFYVYVARSFSLGIVPMILLGLLLLGLAALSIQFVNTAELVGRSGDLTGRGDLWSEVWRITTQRPLTGYGYGTIWNPTDDSLWIQESLMDLTWVSYHAHNGVLQVASELGLPLTTLVVIFALMQLVEILYSHHRLRPEGALFVLGFCVALLISNYSEARLLDNRELFWIFFVALPISLMRQVVVMPAPRAQAALARRLSPAVRDGLVKRRQSARSRTDVKRLLIGRKTALDEAPEHISVGMPRCNSKAKVNRRLVKHARAQGLAPGARPPFGKSP